MEKWDLYDREGNLLGKTIHRGARFRSGEHHLVTHVWVVNSAGRLLIQRRSSKRRMMPNIWAITSGSAVAGEDSATAARRELEEELGIALPDSAFLPLGRLVRRNSLCDVYLVQRDIAVPDMKLQKEEVSQVRWVTGAQLYSMVNERRFHHYGDPYFRFVAEGIRRETGVLLFGEEGPYAD
ncbi:MAG: NUDIX domain-containing protein [Clostridia bacterium]|nr:NUDIX domain-containing protein [Clostridia bacterium]